jgi:hypothetical protein
MLSPAYETHRTEQNWKAACHHALAIYFRPQTQVKTSWFVGLFDFILLFSAYKCQNYLPNQGTEDETTNNHSHNHNGGTMYDLWVIK